MDSLVLKPHQDPLNKNNTARRPGDIIQDHCQYYDKLFCCIEMNMSWLYLLALSLAGLAFVWISSLSADQFNTTNHQWIIISLYTSSIFPSPHVQFTYLWPSFYCCSPQILTPTHTLSCLLYLCWELRPLCDVHNYPLLITWLSH